MKRQKIEEKFICVLFGTISCVRNLPEPEPAFHFTLGPPVERLHFSCQTHCPQMGTFALNDRYMKYLLQRVRLVMKFTLTLTYHADHAITRGHIMSNRPNRLSCPRRRFVVERTVKSAKKRSRDLRRKPIMERNLYVVEVVEVDTSRKRLKIHFVGCQ